jgi:FkbH-like protein
MTSVPEQMAGIRQLCQSGDWEAAARELRRLLGRPLSYSELARLNRTVDMVAQHAPATMRQSRIAILGSSTTALLPPLLKALAFRDGIRAEFYEGLYGAYQQEILNPESGLYAFAPNVIILALHWRDLHLSPAIDHAQEAQALVETQAGRFAQFWQTLAERSSAHVIQYAFDLPAEEAWGSLSMALPGGRARLIHAVNEQLRREAHGKSVSILETTRVAMEVGLARWSDPLMWWKAKQHPGPEALPALAEALLAQVRAICGLTRKVIAVDLDNTLWGGVIGEDGLDGIKVGPGTPEGEAHAALQQYLKELSMRGILLAVCSKNNPEDAQLPFGRHPGMVLRLEDFAAFVANWKDKATNLRAIADELSLGLDSFVFLDDNPMEREWIRSQLPQVAMPEGGASVYGFQRALDRGRYFESLVLSKEDLARARQYRDEAQRRELQQGAQSMGDFLAGLKMQAACLPVTPANLERVTQLTNKTNQFNLTTRRYTRPQVQELTALPGAWARAFQLEDCFGGYGLIGVIFCRRLRPSAWEIDTWLMSCRVLGRQMEQFMFDQLMAAAQMAGIEELIGVYRPTGKNALVAQHYDKLAFRLVDNGPQELRYSFGVPSEPWTPRATFIRLEP